jgi:hypothetical protein
VRHTRTIAIAATAVMALLNLPTGLAAGPSDLPSALAWAFTIVGIAGVVATVALARRTAWGRDGIVLVGVLNAIGGVAALAVGNAAGIVGLVLGAAAAGFGLRSEQARIAPTPWAPQDSVKP